MIDIFLTKPQYEITIPIVVKAKANHYRFNSKSKTFYKSKKLINSENEFKKHLKKLRNPFANKIAIELTFRIKRSSIRDVDNLIKTTLDLLQQDVIKNDNIVYAIFATKEQVKNNEPEETTIKIYKI